mmetsp:Transcript_9211/g.18378  ORF Transcript_9211/g.18378 Transcript_9211/m.18378 type:complete len:230 (+) Transcript_9211:138-827(+)|eukprot:CAMPEP_0181322224 /NCGR_PEP_ID=MMETSP1101-20121128/19114_1 /TAXON_ID=46948 /ORGANISM="Rhodomonas abbreviata, Strain Caron Lab Isolate" /LENGTH=229 /DNA_ID=CAMNT_0023430123 /DNA_START=124 /DNA_END=813 /DNA_ORIENTATION=+
MGANFSSQAGDSEGANVLGCCTQRKQPIERGANGTAAGRRLSAQWGSSLQPGVSSIFSHDEASRQTTPKSSARRGSESLSAIDNNKTVGRERKKSLVSIEVPLVRTESDGSGGDKRSPTGDEPQSRRKSTTQRRNSITNENTNSPSTPSMQRRNSITNQSTNSPSMQRKNSLTKAPSMQRRKSLTPKNKEEVVDKQNFVPTADCHMGFQSDMFAPSTPELMVGVTRKMR